VQPGFRGITIPDRPSLVQGLAMASRGLVQQATEAFQAFNSWAVLNGHAPITQTKFGNQMKVERGTHKGKTIYQDFALLPAKPKLRVVQ
jgi:hypothetical protein